MPKLVVRSAAPVLLLLLLFLAFILTACEDDEKYQVTGMDLVSNKAGSSAVFSGPNRIAPKDILEEVEFSGAYGGPGGMTQFCRNTDHYPETTIDLGEVPVTAVGAVEESQDLYLYGWFEILSCGWSRDEQVDVVVEFPDGREYHEHSNPLLDINSGNWYISWTYKTLSTDPLGMYRIILKNRTHQTVAQLKLVAPSKTNVYEVAVFDDNGQIRTGLFLYGFQPLERVRIVEYYWDDVSLGWLRFVSWQAFNVNEDGQLMVVMDNTETHRLELLAVVGDTSGVVMTHESGIKGSVLRN